MATCHAVLFVLQENRVLFCSVVVYHTKEWHSDCDLKLTLSVSSGKILLPCQFLQDINLKGDMEGKSSGISVFITLVT